MGVSITIDPSGRILVAGSSTNTAGFANMAIWRYLPDGTLDPSFGPDGNGIAIQSMSIDQEGRSIAIDPSGRILVTGK